jgi:hypothetical protein
VVADPKVFECELGPQEDWDHLLAEHTLDTDDLCEMAARLKRDFEAAAREGEQRRDDAKASAEAHEKAFEGVDLDGRDDVEALQNELEAAIAARAEITQGLEAASMVASEAREWERKLRAADAAYEGPTVEEAAERCQAAERASATAAQKVVDLEKALDAARAEDAAVASAWEATGRAHSAAVQYRDMRELCQSAIDAAAEVEVPSEVEASAAEEAVAACRAALTQAGVIAKAKQSLRKADDLQEAIAEYSSKAEDYRRKAASIDDALSAAVASDALTVKDGRVWTQHPERGDVLYADRSEGWRCKTAVDEAVKRIKRTGDTRLGLIPVAQAAMEGIQPANRLLLRDHAIKCGVLILT